MSVSGTTRSRPVRPGFSVIPVGNVAMYTLRELFDGSIQEKIVLAQALYEEVGPGIAGCDQGLSSLARLRRLADGLRRLMGTMGIFALCADCGSRPGGGCCSAVMANETDALLLCMNLLVGHVVSVQRDDGVECCFLGSGGCSLYLKPMFCLNYNCHGIRTAIPPPAMAQLAQATGLLLQEQYAMETLILNRLREAGEEAACCG